LIVKLPQMFKEHWKEILGDHPLRILSVGSQTADDARFSMFFDLANQVDSLLASHSSLLSRQPRDGPQIRSSPPSTIADPTRPLPSLASPAASDESALDYSGRSATHTRPSGFPAFC